MASNILNDTKIAFIQSRTPTMKYPTCVLPRLRNSKLPLSTPHLRLKRLKFISRAEYRNYAEKHDYLKVQRTCT